MRLLSSISLMLLASICDGFISDETKQLVEQWAPIVWLHSEDIFLPSSVQFHLDNCQVRDEEEHLVQDLPNQDNIVTGPQTSGYHLNTRYEIDCVDCYQPFFFGQPLSEVPCYTFVTEHNDSCNTVDVTYTTYYPFNFGKVVCVGIDDQNGTCVGGPLKTFGNHVGDWEHVSLRFQNGEPSEIYVGVHSFGAWYTWNSTASEFQFDRGEPLIRYNDERELVKVDVNYPPTLSLEDGRPAVFSANGSHGVWAQPGKHIYLQIFTVHLEDFCERGQKWETWNNLEIIDSAELGSFTGDKTWIDFEGRWGNIAKMGCELEPIFGECGLVGGPGGPRKYLVDHNFEQPPVCPSVMPYLGDD